MATEDFDRLRAERAKSYLLHVAESRKAIDAYEAELRMLRDRIDHSIKAIDYSRDRVTGTGDPQKMATEVATLVDLERDGIEVIDELKSELADCSSRLSQVSAIPGIVLRCRYLYGKSYDRMSSELGYSKSSLYAFARAGLVELYEVGIPAPWRLPEYSAM